MYIAPLKTEFTQCIDNQVEAGNSGGQSSQTQGSLIWGEQKMQKRKKKLMQIKR